MGIDFTRQCEYLLMKITTSFKPATHLAILYVDRRDRRKSPGVRGPAIAIFADRRDRRIKSPTSGMSDIGDLNLPAFFKCARSRDFYVYYYKSPVKPAHQVGRFHHMSFQNCHIAAIGEKNRQVCPHQSVAKITCDFRWLSNSPRLAYKIARCVAGFG